MTQVQWILLAASFSFLAGGVARGAARQAPDPQEVYEVIRTNLPGLTDAQLQSAAVNGLVKELQPRVWLIGSDATNPATGPVLGNISVFDGPVAYLRIGRVGEGLAQKMSAACTDLARTNALQGIVLDLRFADGEDYREAAAAADLFVTKQQLLLDWGAESAKASEKTNALRMPVVVLVNRETAAAAEALAAVLRDAGVAVVIGTNTAGHAMIAEDFPLRNGDHLRIAKKGLKLGSGAVLSTSGVTPDIAVAVNLQDEAAYWANPFIDFAGTNLAIAVVGANSNKVAGATNAPSRRRMNEAELVRERREGMNLGPMPATLAHGTEPEPPVVRDPALARALDLIKGLAVVRHLRGQ